MKLQTSLKVSELPFQKNLEEYDFNFQSKQNRQKVLGLCGPTFVERKKNGLFLRPPGKRKIYLAAVLAMRAA